jgi:succinate dehydrogenase / fumarate reductase cytochrome b subunit
MAVAHKDISLPVPQRASRLAILWRSHIGKKALMAVSGIVLFLYLIAHMIGNLQAFAGPEQINAYGRFLRVAPLLLWLARAVLLLMLVVHVVAGVQLYLERNRARGPIRYADYRPGASSTASRTMIWSGILIFAFVVYHVLDLTVGVANPDFVHGDIYHNVLATFGQAAGVIAYLVAMVGVGFHLWHGVYSMFQSLGMTNRRLTPKVQRFAAAVAVLLTLGFASIPLGVLVGIIG